MNNNGYESLTNDKDEYSEGSVCLLRRRGEKNFLKIRLSRVFSSGNLKSPKSPASSCSPASRASSPGRSPTIKSRDSWQLHSDDTSPKSCIFPVSSRKNSLSSPRTLQSPGSMWNAEYNNNG